MKSGLQCTPFFTILSTVPFSEACLYYHINWAVVQVQHHSSHGVSQSLTPVSGGRTRLRAAFQFNVQKQPVPESIGGSVARKTCSGTRTDSHLSGKKLSGGGTSTSFSDSQDEGKPGGQHSLLDTVYNFLHIIIHCAGWYPSPLFMSVERHYFQKVCA